MNLLNTLISVVIMSVIFHLLLIRFARSLRLVDIPNSRSTHKKVTPRGAGIAMFASVMFSLALFNLEHLYTYYLVYLAITIVFIIGLIDDIIDTSPRLKFLFITIAAGILFWNGTYVHTLGDCFGYIINVPVLIAFPLTIFAISGLTNAVNLIDGLDGLAGLVSLIILNTFFLIGYKFYDPIMIILSLSFMVTLVVFLFFNWFPAKVFMGDSGSLTLGFVIAVLSMMAIKYIAPISVLFIIAVPLLDTFIVMTRRIQRGQSPFKADKNHLHHFLMQQKGDVPLTVVLFAALQLAFAIIGFEFHDADSMVSLALFGILFFIFLHLFDHRVKHRKKKKKKRKVDTRIIYK